MFDANSAARALVLLHIYNPLAQPNYACASKSAPLGTSARKDLNSFAPMVFHNVAERSYVLINRLPFAAEVASGLVPLAALAGLYWLPPLPSVSVPSALAVGLPPSTCEV